MFVDFLITALAASLSVSLFFNFYLFSKLKSRINLLNDLVARIEFEDKEVVKNLSEILKDKNICLHDVTSYRFKGVLISPNQTIEYCTQCNSNKDFSDIVWRFKHDGEKLYFNNLRFTHEQFVKANRIF